MLDEPSYAQAARRIRDAIATDLERDRAVEEIEARIGAQAGPPTGGGSTRTAGSPVAAG